MDFKIYFNHTTYVRQLERPHTLACDNITQTSPNITTFYRNSNGKNDTHLNVILYEGNTRTCPRALTAG